MTDRTKVDVSKNLTICCDNCLNDDTMDWDSTCVLCAGSYSYFQGLKEDKRCKSGYRVILSKNTRLKDIGTTAEDLLKRIEAEKRSKNEMPMFGGLTLESVYS